MSARTPVLLLLLLGRRPAGRRRPLTRALTWGMVLVLEDRRLGRFPPQTQQQLCIDPLERPRSPRRRLVRQMLAPRWGAPVSRTLPRADLPRLVRKRRGARAVARWSGRRGRDRRADPVHDPRVRDAHRRRVGQVGIRDAVAHVRGVGGKALHVLLELIPTAQHRLPALHIGRAKQEPARGERRGAGFLREAHVEDVDGK